MFISREIFYKAEMRKLNTMKTRPHVSETTVIFCLLAVLLLGAASGGCTQASPQQPAPQAPITAVQPDNNHITIAFHGGAGMDSLIEMEVTITDSAGKSQTQSMGSRLATTPIRTGATLTVTGAFSGKDQVQVTGYFSDGSKRTIVDTTV
jgi:hypothetical protein